MVKEVICTVCPIGCRIKVEGENGVIKSVEDYKCNRGLTYAENEFLHPVRILTTTVKTDVKGNPLLPVRSNKPIPKEKLMDCMAEVSKVCVSAPVERYQVIIENICGTGVDMVASGCLK